MIGFNRITLLWLMCFYLPSCFGAEVAEFSLLRGTARLAAGTVAGTSELLLQATGSPAALADLEPAAKDTTEKGVGEATLGTAEKIYSSDEGRRIWRIPVTLDKLPATQGIWQHKMQLTVKGSNGKDLPYSVSNAPAPSLELKLSPLPAEWNVSNYPCQRIRIAASGTRATGIVVTSTLVSERSKQPLSQSLFLSYDGLTPAKPSQMETAINDTGDALFLCVDAAFGHSGKFAGTVNVSASEKPEGVVITATLLKTTTLAFGFGVSLLLLGCVLALIAKVIVPGRVAQAKLLLPASLLLERVADLESIMGKRPTGAPSIDRIAGVVSELKKSLSKEGLIKAGLVPGMLGFVFGAPDTVKYQAFLEESSLRIQVLGILLVDGISELDKLVPPLPDLIKKVDAIARLVPRPTPAEAFALVQAIIGQVPGPARQPLAFGPKSSSELIFQIESAASFVLVLCVILSFVTGLAVLILNNPAFGAPLEQLACLLWGLGVSSSGAITQNPAATAIGLKLPEKL